MKKFFIIATTLLLQGCAGCGVNPACTLAGGPVTYRAAGEILAENALKDASQPMDYSSSGRYIGQGCWNNGSHQYDEVHDTGVRHCVNSGADTPKKRWRKGHQK